MAVAWRREGRPNLETKPWNVLTVQVADLQRKYLVKGVFEEDGYHVMLSDTCSLWEESIHTEKIVKRLKNLNPSVEAPLTVLNAALSSHLDSQNNTADYSITTPTPSRNADGPAANPSDKIVLSIQTTLSSLPLEWQFISTKCAPDKLSTHLVLPLLSMVGELGRRQQHLTQLLNKKDKELQDFNEQGYTVTRKYLKTAPFMSSAFENEMITSDDFEVTACRDMQILAAPASQRLYRDVAMVRRWSKNKEDFPAVAEAPVGGLETTGTWAAKIPPSLLPTVPASHSPTTTTVNTTPTTPPAKRPAPPSEESPSKETELSRREALQKKLDKDKNKTKKKRKLM